MSMSPKLDPRGISALRRTDEETSVIHLHLLWIVPLTVLFTLVGVAWGLYGDVDAKGVAVRVTYETIGILLGWWLRGHLAIG